MRTPKARHAIFALLAAIAMVLALPRAAHAAGAFKLRSTEVNEVSGAWHLYATIELPKAPLTAHQPMRFFITRTMAYERSLVDGRSEPVMTRQALQNQSPTIESLDVNFGDATGKIFKGTRFDFGLTRTRGYEAGEYTVEIRTSDGTKIGSPARLILKGDNPVVDRRSIAFNANDKGIKKIEAYDAGAPQANADEPPVAKHEGLGEVEPTGVATSFVPAEGFEETEEEMLKTRSPRGCGCAVPGTSGPAGAALLFLPALGIGAVLLRRRAGKRAA